MIVGGPVVRILLTGYLFLVLLTSAMAATTVPPGNRNATQPPIHYGAISRTKAIGNTFENKYRKIYKLLARDRKLMRKIKTSAKRFDIDPIHLIGALVGEHTYNVDALDRIQTYYVKAMSYLGQPLRFRYDGVKIEDFIRQPAFTRCNAMRDNYDQWTCIERVWDTTYRGKKVAGRSWPNDRFSRVFFQPLYAGQTFGLGQIEPLTAIKINDIVRKYAPREPRLSVKKAPLVYSTIMEPDSTLLYMAAVLRHSIDSYRRIAGYDISANPGVTATLYNLGNVTLRAQALKAKNDKRRSQGKKSVLPTENYYGWLINDKVDELRRLL